MGFTILYVIPGNRRKDNLCEEYVFTTKWTYVILLGARLKTRSRCQFNGIPTNYRAELFFTEQ